jgi:serine/threonine-protein kinase
VAGEEYRAVQEIPEFSPHLPSVTPTQSKHDLGPPDIRGILADKPAVVIFLEMYRSSETGLLHFECSDVRKDVYLEGGVPRYVSSNVASELLGEYLVRIGSISRLELDMALAVMDRYEGRLGDTLIGLDIMDSISLIRDITRQVKDRLFDLYAWEAGEFQFYRDAEHVRQDFRLSAHPLDLIREGCLASLERQDMESWYERHKDAVLTIDAGAEFPLEAWEFKPTYNILLADLEKERTLEELMRPYQHASPEVRGKLLRVIKFGTTVGFVSGLERPSVTELPVEEER